MMLLLGESRGVFAYRVFWEGFGEGGSGELNFSLVICCGFFLSLVPVSPAQRDEARRVEVQCRVLVRGALCLSSSLFKPLQRRYTV